MTVVAGLTALLLTASHTETFALVVTNNRSLQSSREDLRYADDDGVAYADLFTERFGRGHVVLLTELDAQTRALAPGWTAAPAPTTKNLESAVALLAESAAAMARDGARVEVFVVLAGHGDVDQGTGYLELQDGRLTARDLEEKVVKKLPVARLHLVIDSCNSYFMLSPRKPGGRRWAAESLPVGSLASRYPYLGSFISTNAEAVSYEWSELQSGIFSYEVRSGLRGAADADGDGAVTYAELAAFVQQANKSIKNEQFRPRVAVAAPQDDPHAVLLDVASKTARSVHSVGDRARRLVVRDEQGVRLADAHQEAGTPLTLALPAGSAALEVFERLDGASGRPVWKRRSVPPEFKGELDALDAVPPQTQARGESAIFESLFDAPYGRLAFAQYQLSAPPLPEQPLYGVTIDDIERLDRHLGALVASDRFERLVRTGAGAATWGTADVATKVVDVLLSGPMMTATLLEQTAPMRLRDRLRSFDVSSDEARARAMRLTEHDFEFLAGSARSERMAWSVVSMLAGTVAIGVPVGMRLADRMLLGAPELASILVGAAALTTGMLFLTLWRSAPERAWAAYLADTGRGAATSASVSLSVGAGSLGLQGTF